MYNMENYGEEREMQDKGLGTETERSGRSISIEVLQQILYPIVNNLKKKR